MSKGKVRVDRKAWDAMRANIDAMGEQSVRVGVLGSKGGNAPHGDEGLTMIELAVIHEFGSPAANIPERSFIRSAFEKNRAELAEFQGKLANAVILGKIRPAQALAMLGDWGVAKVRAGITEGDGIPPPLAASTIARKGSSRPLIDTGRMNGAVAYEVDDGGEGLPE